MTKTKFAEAAGFRLAIKLGRRLIPTVLSTAAAASLMLVALPLHAQYTSVNLTPPGGAPARLNGVAGGQQAGAFGITSHGLLLLGTATSAVDLHPAGFINSQATATDGVQQCGYGQITDLNEGILWEGAASPAINLTPSVYNQSYCFGVYHGQQIGYAESIQYFTATQHALLWSGSSGAFVDLHPALGFTFSKGLGIFAGQEVGTIANIPYGPVNTFGYESSDHAVMWSGTAASAIDLHPSGFDASAAMATNGIQQGGWAYSASAAGGSNLHAMMWYGSAASAVDLHPYGWVDTRVNAMGATMQVGEGWTGPANQSSSYRHALAWSGTAASVIDLNQFLPAGYQNAAATGIDEAGNIVGYAYNTPAIGTALPADAIAVMFIPGKPSPWALSSVTLNPTSVAPGATSQGTVTLAGPAPAKGVTITFLSTNTSLAPSPAGITIPAGNKTGTFTVTTNAAAALTVPTSMGIWASDSSISKFASLTVVPVVKLSSISVTPVQGGLSTNGTVSLNIPAQTGGALVTLTSAHPAEVALPATVTIPQGSSSAVFTVTTTPVKTSVSIPVSAAYDGVTVKGVATLNPAPVVALGSISVIPVQGGSPFQGTVFLTNPARGAGVTVHLFSSSTALATVPATVLVPAGSMTATFTGTTVIVKSDRSVTISAKYNGVTVSAALDILQTPTCEISEAEYWSISQLFKVTATTLMTNSILTFGTNPAGPALGTMQIEKGLYSGAMPMATAPALAVVWNTTHGGTATMPVTVKAK